MVETVASSMTVEAIAAGLKSAMRRMPATVALITTRDPESGEPHGLAASAVIPVSMDPPSMLIAVNQNASAHASIARAGKFCINLLGTTHTELVGAFSNSALRESRFQGDHWDHANGLPFLPGACASIFCEVRHSVRHGTHELFVGDVIDVRTGDGSEPMGWLDGGFARLGKL